MRIGILLLVAGCGSSGSSGFSEFARQVQSPASCKTAADCRVLRDRAAGYIAECFRSGGGPCTRESEVYDLASRHLNQATLRESPPLPAVDASGSTTAVSQEAPPPTPPVAPIDPGAQQQANDRLDAAVVDGCFVKLDAVVSDYEAIRSPTEEQTASAAGAFARTLNGQCGMKDRVEADPRYQAILRRLAPLSARMTVLVQRKCHAIKKEVTCFDTCVEGKDLFAWDPCRNKCISRPRDGVGIAWVIEELKTELRSLGCK